MGSPLDPAFANIFVGVLKYLLFKKFSNPNPNPLLYFRYVNDTFSISAMKQNATSFFKNSMLYIHPWFLLTKKKLIIHCHFLIFRSKNLTKNFLPKFTEDRHLRNSIHAEVHLNQRRGRQILLALLFTEKFALPKPFK